MRTDATPAQRWVCGRCGYDLTRPVSERCPECGSLIIDVRSPRDRQLDTLANRGTLLAVAGCVILLLPPVFGGFSTPTEALLAHGVVYGLYLSVNVVLSLIPVRGVHDHARRFTTLAWISAVLYGLIGLVYIVGVVLRFSLAFIPAIGLLGLAVGFVLIARQYSKRAAWLYPEAFGG